MAYASLSAQAARRCHLHVHSRRPQLAQDNSWPSVRKQGQYGVPPSRRVWALQLVVWCLATVAARFVVGLTMLLSRRILVHLAEVHPQHLSLVCGAPLHLRALFALGLL